MDIRLIFEFLRYCLDEKLELSEGVVERIDWDELLEFAKKQALIGICFEGIKRLGNIDSNKPSAQNIATWVTVSSKIAMRNKQMFDLAPKVSQKFARLGFANCVLKGQGNALMYPHPEARSSGDIDIWLKAPVEEGRNYSLARNRKEILEYVRQIVPDAEACYHHVDFPVYRTCPIEVPFTPSYLSNPFANRRLQQWYGEYVMSATAIYPTADFNRVYQLTHIQHHFFDEGVGLRQLIDYYYLLRCGFTEEERRRDMTLICRFGLKPMAGAVMYVLHEVLGLDERYLLMKPDERRGKVLLQEMLQGGNFGKSNNFRRYNVAEKYMVKTWRNLRRSWLFPNEALWEPIFRTYLFFWKKLALR